MRSVAILVLSVLFLVAGVSTASVITPQAFVPTTINYPGATSTQARGINNPGEVVGTYTCADGGCTCSVHGGWNSPRQPPAPNEDSATAKTVRAFGGLSATLTFREDGLHAAVTIERK